MSCERTVLEANTAPVQKVIQNGENGLRCDFLDVDRSTTHTFDVLRHANRYAGLGVSARRTVLNRYDQAVTFPQFVNSYREAADGNGVDMQTNRPSVSSARWCERNARAIFVATSFATCPRKSHP